VTAPAERRTGPRERRERRVKQRRVLLPCFAAEPTNRPSVERGADRRQSLPAFPPRPLPDMGVGDTPETVALREHLSPKQPAYAALAEGTPRNCVGEG
jgi:hypothetical protein